MRHLSILIEIDILRCYVLVCEELIDARLPRIEAVEHLLHNVLIFGFFFDISAIDIIRLRYLLGEGLTLGLLRLVFTKDHHGSNDECHAEHCKAEQLAKLTHGHTSKQHHHEYDDAEQQCR